MYLHKVQDVEWHQWHTLPNLCPMPALVGISVAAKVPYCGPVKKEEFPLELVRRLWVMLYCCNGNR